VRVDASRVATPRRPNVDKESLEMDVRPRMQYILRSLLSIGLAKLAFFLF
jgi:hypothetical protein